MPPKPRKPPPRPTPGQGDRTRQVLYVVGALGFVGVAVAFWLASRPAGVDEGSAAEARTALEAAGCTLELTQAPANAADHTDITSPDQVSEDWTSDPPTAGPHYGETAVYGAFTDPLQQARVLHNLEHGAAYIQYGPDVPEATVAELRSFYDRNLNGTLLAPYPPLGEKIALGAWIGDGGERGQGVLATCTTFADDAYQAFLTAYQFKGPERFSPSAMAPGQH